MTIHIVGAGLAGLSCALAAADAGHEVVVHEGARQAGGRSRSWPEPTLGRVVDNGTHMVVGANQAVFDFLKRIGSEDSLMPGPTAFPMLDLRSGRVWTATPLRLLGSVLASMWRMPRNQDAPISAALGRSKNYRRFWDPLALAVMNTPADRASALVFRRVLQRTLWKGQKASQPWLVKEGLSESFIAPALAALEKTGATIRLNDPLRALERDGGRAVRVSFDSETITLGARDKVVLATPWVVARGFLPELPELPASPIVNVHFRMAEPPTPPNELGFLGLLGGTGEWMFVRGDLISVTISGAAAVIDLPGEDIAALVWQDVARALGVETPPVATRVIKEKRATLFHTPEVEARRPAQRVADNLILAGDWTATGLPCTLEGALTSGAVAASLLR
jgi:phytoene dehydrogenase-like protein